MKKNVGSVDRIIRLVIAAVLGYLYYNGTLSGTLGIVGLVVAAVMLLTAIVNYCPLYSLLNLSTDKKQ